MTLAAVEYKTIRDAILTLLRANSATLNTGLATTITSTSTQIIAGNPLTTPLPNTLFPLVLVKISNKAEEWTNIGAAGRKKPKVIFKIYGLTRTLQEAGTDDEIMLLARNIETVFRNNIAFDSSIIYCQPTNTDYGLVADDIGQYVNIVVIDLECYVEVK